MFYDKRPWLRALTGWLGAILLVLAGNGVLAEETWTNFAPIPVDATQVMIPGGAFVDGKLYAFASYSSNVSGSAGYGFTWNPATNTWSSVAVPPVETGGWAVTGQSVAAIGTKLYFFGLAEDCTNPVSALLTYDTASDAWDSPSVIPGGNQRCGAATAAIGNKLYAAGGRMNDETSSTRLDIYDAIANTWATGAPLPEGVEVAAAAAINGRFYLAGGFKRTGPSSGTFSSELWVYEPLADAWTQLASMATAREAALAAAVNGKLHVLGGTAAGSLATHEVYDPVSGTWTTVEPMTVARAWPLVAGGLDHIYVTGGFDTDSVQLTGSEMYDFGALQVSAGSDQTVSSDAIGQGTVTLSATVLSGTAANFAWSDGHGFSATGPSITVTLPLGAHTLTVTGSNATETALDSVSVNV